MEYTVHTYDYEVFTVPFSTEVIVLYMPCSSFTHIIDWACMTWNKCMYLRLEAYDAIRGSACMLLSVDFITVRKYQKQIMVSSILPKKQTKLTQDSISS